MAGATGKSLVGRFGVHAAVLVFVVIWTVPTLGSWSRRSATRTRSRVSGWWSSFFELDADRGRPTAAPLRRRSRRTASSSSRQHLRRRRRRATSAPSASSRPTRREFAAGATADLGDGVTLQVNADGSFVMIVAEALRRRARPAPLLCVVGAAEIHPRQLPEVLFSEGIGRSFINSLTVTIPATIIPILIAAFAAYALAWMRFPGRALLIAVIVGLLVVPLQMSLIPLLKLYNGVGVFFGVPVKTYLGIWLAHTGFGLPLRDLSAAQLHGRPAARAHGIGAHRRRQRLRDLRQDRAAAVVPGARLLRDLPVPVGVERPARRHGLPRRGGRPARADRPSSMRCSARAAATGRSSRPRPSSPSSCR